MKNLNYWLAILLLNLLSANAQTWEYYKDFPVNVKPVDIDVNNAGTLFMLSSDQRFFYKLLNQDWQEMPGFPVANPDCISVVKNSNRMYFGDYFQGLVYTDDFGQNWQQTWLTTNPVSGFHESVIELSNITNPNLFIGGSNNLVPTMFIYTNNGQNGTIFQYDSTNNQSNIASELYLTSTNKLLIGTDDGGILLVNQIGDLAQPTSQTQNQIFRFTEDNNGKVYALGFNYNNGLNFLVSSTDYLTWDTVALPNTEKYTSILFDPATQSLWLGSENGLYRSNPITTNTPEWNLATFNNVTQSTVEIVKHGANIYNFSSDYIAQQLSSSNNQWNTITQGLKGVVNYAGFGSNGKIFTSSYSSNTVSSANNAASQWSNTIITGNAPSVSNMFVKPNGRIYLNMGLSLKKSIDNGITYTDITPPNMIYSFWRFEVGENNSLFAVKYTEREKLYRSTDDGLTWSLFADFTSNIPFDPAIIESISEDSNGVIYVTTESLDISQGINKLRYTTDQGITWNTLIYDVSQTLGSCGSVPLVISHGNKTYFSACSYSFEVNIASQNPFQPYNFPWGDSGYLQFGSFRVNSLGHHYLLDEFLYKSVDGGTTWINLGRPSELNSATDMNGVYIDANDDVFIMTSTYVFLAPENRGFYKVTETLGTENPESNFVDVFPNPATNSITIQTTNTISSVSIFDMLGKNVMNDSRNVIDISNLSQGMYIIKVTQENEKTFSSKFIKE